MALRILLVCTANVCRSPVMEAAFHSELARFGMSIDIMSRGIDGSPSGSLCKAAAAERSRIAGKSVDELHAPRRLNAAEIGSAQLVLVASRAERAHLARLRPDGRGKVFTLREAQLLGDEVFATDEWRDILAIRGARARLDAYVELLNNRRGTLALDPARRWSRRPQDPGAALDISDAHADGGLSHRKVFHLIEASAAAVSAHLALITGSGTVLDERR